tara:strand:+ start:1473 stop:2090 length:618 start_codon:yes stop_codon:yes gene_type:complete
MKKNKSSKNWIIQQHRDIYFKEAKNSGLRSRSAFKLVELEKKFKFLKKSKTVIDLGCYPGGWSQIIKKNTRNCRILSIDTKVMKKIDGVDFICCDFINDNAKQKILKSLKDKADVIVSDMAANTTGNKDLDCIRTNSLCLEVIKFSRFALKDNGVVISKLFNGYDFLNVKKIAMSKFKKVDFFKPESSKDHSKETYIHCKGIKTL